MPVDIGAQFAYKVSVAPGRGNLKQEEKSNADEKADQEDQASEKSQEARRDQATIKSGLGRRAPRHRTSVRWGRPSDHSFRRVRAGERSFVFDDSGSGHDGAAVSARPIVRLRGSCNPRGSRTLPCVKGSGSDLPASSLFTRQSRQSNSNGAAHH